MFCKFILLAGKIHPISSPVITNIIDMLFVDNEIL